MLIYGLPNVIGDYMCSINSLTLYDPISQSVDICIHIHTPTHTENVISISLCVTRNQKSFICGKNI